MVHDVTEVGDRVGVVEVHWWASVELLGDFDVIVGAVSRES